MKKKLLSITLLSSLSFLALVSCGKENEVVLTNEAGESVTIKASSKKEDVITALSVLQAQNYEVDTTAVGIKASLDATQVEKDVESKVVLNKSTVSIDADVRVGLGDYKEDKAYSSTYDMLADMQLYGSINASETSTAVLDLSKPKEKTVSKIKIAAKAYEGTVQGLDMLGTKANYSGVFVVPTKFSMTTNGKEDSISAAASQIIGNKNAIYASYEMLPEQFAQLGISYVQEFKNVNVSTFEIPTEKEELNAATYKISNVSNGKITFKVTAEAPAFETDAIATTTLEITVDSKTGLITKATISQKNYKSNDANYSYAGSSLKLSASINYNNDVSFPQLKNGMTMIDGNLIFGMRKSLALA